jgi:5-methylcytosine-specific restriction endonuclease McrA
VTSDRQSSFEIVSVKDEVRARDGYRCTRCGLSNQDHELRYGRQLDVHRVVPGSRYGAEGCVTLCKKCHGDEPRRAPGQPDYAHGIYDRLRVRLDLPNADHAELRVLAAKSGMSMSQYCAAVVLEAIRKGREVKPPKGEK